MLFIVSWRFLSCWYFFKCVLKLNIKTKKTFNRHKNFSYRDTISLFLRFEKLFLIIFGGLIIEYFYSISVLNPFFLIIHFLGSYYGWPNARSGTTSTLHFFFTYHTFQQILQYKNSSRKESQDLDRTKTNLHQRAIILMTRQFSACANPHRQNTPFTSGRQRQ